MKTRSKRGKKRSFITNYEISYRLGRWNEGVPRISQHTTIAKARKSASEYFRKAFLSVNSAFRIRNIVVQPFISKRATA